MKTLVVTFVALLVTQSSPVSPFEGHWRTDIPPGMEWSSIGIAPSGISFTVTRDTVKITNHWIRFHVGDPARNEARQDEHVLHTDGKARQSPNATNWSIVAKWSNRDVLEVVDTGIGTRTVTVHTTYSLSADRRTLTRRFVYSEGHIDERVFYR
jgi:hypothetical protein